MLSPGLGCPRQCLTLYQQQHQLPQARTVQAAAAARGGKGGRYRQSQQQQQQRDGDAIIAPLTTLDSALLPAQAPAAADEQQYLPRLPEYVGSVPAAAATRGAGVGRTNTNNTNSKGSRKPTSTRHDGRRGALVKIRVAPRRYRLRASFDSPLQLHIRPGDPDFEGRLASEINSVYGPKRLNKIIADFSPHFTPSHAVAAIAQLAGIATARGGGVDNMPADVLSSVYQGPAAKVARVLEGKMQQATLKDCARAVYGLARLRLHLPSLLTAVESTTSGQLSGAATPQCLAGLAVGLAHWGYVPSQAWIRELCSAAFVAAPGCSAQDLANLMFSLAVWRVPLSQPFLQRCLTAFRGHWGAAGTTPAALLRFLYALTQLPPCQPLPSALAAAQPPDAAVYLHHEAYRQQRELQLLGEVMQLRGDRDSGAAAGGGSGGGAEQQQQQQQQSDSNSTTTTTATTTSTPTSYYRLPSFNWLSAYLVEARRLIDRFEAPELSALLWSCAALNHTPDLIFMEAWFRASAVHMWSAASSAASSAAAAASSTSASRGAGGSGRARGPQQQRQQQQQWQQEEEDEEEIAAASPSSPSQGGLSVSSAGGFTPASLSTAVQALGLLQPGRDVAGSVSGRWITLVLDSSRQMMVRQLLIVQQPQQWGQAGSQPAAAPASQDALPWRVSDLSKLLWGLAELKVWPGKPWLDTWMAVTGPLLTPPSSHAAAAAADASTNSTSAAATSTAAVAVVSPSDLSDIVWALARLRYSSSSSSSSSSTGGGGGGGDTSWVSQHLTPAINQHLQGFSVQGLAVVIWGYTRLGFRPDRSWLLRFRAVAADAAELKPQDSSSSSGEQLAQFVAAFLAQQNRQRFADSNRPMTFTAGRGGGRSGSGGGRSAAAGAAAGRGGRGRGRQQQQQQQRMWPRAARTS